MRVTTCTINVGKSLGNQSLVLDLFSFVDVVFILERPVGRSGKVLDNKDGNFELMFFHENIEVEVFVNTRCLGLFSLVRGWEQGVIISYVDVDGIVRKFGGVYLRPGENAAKVKGWLENCNECDIVVRDFNARHPMSGEKSGDHATNTYGRFLFEYANNMFEIDSSNEKTFRNRSSIDLCLYKDKVKNNWTNKAALEHSGILKKLSVGIPDNLAPVRVAWKKIEWKLVQKQLRNISLRNGDRDDITKLVTELLRTQQLRSTCK